MYQQQEIEFNHVLQRALMEYALRKFNQCEQYLLKNNVSERNMCQRLAVYLQEGLSEYIIPDYVVDTEYNRGMHGSESAAKKLDGKCIYLDIAVHKREYDADGCGFSNLICVEMKKASNPKGCEEDEERLKKLTDLENGFFYKTGFMLLADDVSEKRGLRIKSIFRNGEKIEEKKYCGM